MLPVSSPAGETPALPAKRHDLMTRATGIILSFFLFITAMAQTHQHGSQPSGDGKFNPSIAPDARGGFYLAYIQRANGVSDVMLRHSTDGKSFSDAARAGDRAGDATR